jgi:hypothetical protein
MATFMHLKEQDCWINLDHIVRIERSTIEAEGAAVTVADGSTLSVSKADSKRLFKQVRPRKKKKKKDAPSEATGGESGQAPPTE